MMPCDRDFALIEKKRRKKERVVRPSEWVKMVEDSRKKPSRFEVIYVEKPLTDDLAPDGKPLCVVRDYKAVLTPMLKQTVPGLTQFRGVFFTKVSHRIVRVITYYVINVLQEFW